jgi:sirohydrochlorin ferrochelatase
MPASASNLASAQGTGLLLVGHGTRDPVGTAEFLAVAGRVAELAAGPPVAHALLEFAEPSIAAGFRALAAQGARRIVVVPVLLLAAGHAKRDIPAAVAAVAAEFPEVAVEQAPHLGCHEAILALSRRRFDEAVARAADEAADTVLVMIGRGSHDPEATAEMRRFVELRAAPVLRSYTAFVAMAEPSYRDVLEEVARSGAQRIVVQPHLLFGGVLVDRIAAAVAQFAARFPRQQWLGAGPLGPSDLVAQAILARAAEPLSGACAVANPPASSR